MRKPSPLNVPVEWIINPPTLKIRVREEAEELGYDFNSFHKKVAQVRMIQRTGLLRIWNGEDFYYLGVETTLVPLAIALDAQISPPVGVLGDPKDGKRYLFWWVRPQHYPARTLDPLPPEEDE